MNTLNEYKINALLAQGHLELDETLQQWKQKTHLANTLGLFDRDPNPLPRHVRENLDNATKESPTRGMNAEWLHMFTSGQTNDSESLRKFSEK